MTFIFYEIQVGGLDWVAASQMNNWCCGGYTCSRETDCIGGNNFNFIAELNLKIFTTDNDGCL